MDNLTAAQFDALISSSERVLVKFGADWCGPCKALEPQLAKYAASPGAVPVASVDIDAEPALAARFGVQGLPTTIVFKNGQPGPRILGVAPVAKLSSAVQSA
jgi:thioredoxin